MSETKKTKPHERPHPFLRDGEELDPSQPPQDIRKMFHRAVLHDAMVQEMIETLEDDLSGLVEGAGVHCRGIVNSYYNENEEHLQYLMDTLAGVLNVRFRNVSDEKPSED
jgi:hypothetical protein